MAVFLQKIEARFAEKLIFQNLSLSLGKGECWAVVGANGSGKSMLGRLLCGELEIVAGDWRLPQNSAFVSFEREEEILEDERYHDDSNFIGCQDHGTLVRDFILASGGEPRQLEALARRLKFSHLLDRGIRFLSTGELRKALICAALLAEPPLLVLDEPFDGLDRSSCEVLRELIAGLAGSGQRLLLLLNRFSEIPPQTTHLAYLSRCRLLAAGPSQELLQSAELRRFHAYHDSLPQQLPETEPGCRCPQLAENLPLIEMRGVVVQYAGKRVLNQLSWTVNPGEHWKISGPNGSGKTTLLSLISGDNTQAYANDIRLFGRVKGSGESIWQIKQYFGLVSGALQHDYRVGGTVRSAVVSGFFDSIGVYRQVTATQLDIAGQWLEILHLSHLAEVPLRSCSFGEQRLVLIARAMVKQPPLLILDEPCQGLDEINREMVLKLIDHLGRSGATQLLYVTHHPEDHVPCINRSLELVPAKGGGSKALIRSC